MFGHTVSTLQTGITISGNAITGTLKYCDSGALATDWGAGNFIVLKLPDADIENSTVRIGLEPSEGTGLLELDSDKNGVFKITDKLRQKFCVEITVAGETVVQRYDLSGLTCETE